MVRLRVTLSEYRTPFPAPVSNARATWWERAGLLFTLEDTLGHFGQGEAAPLPGYSDETFEACRGALAAIGPAQLDALAATPLGALGDALAREAGDAPPAARAAIEMALLDLKARRASQPLHRLLRELLPEAAPELEFQRLIALLAAEEPRDWQAEAERAVIAGYAGVKVKVGRPGRFDEERAGLADVRRVLGPTRCLRLDANGAWSRETVEPTLAALTEFDPEFIEEPLARGEPWLESPALPVALDESLRDGPALSAASAETHRIVACMLKLGPLGGIFPALSLMRAAHAAGVAVIVSHTFEGPVGLAAAAEFALALGPGPFAHGLAPHGGLHAWLETPAALLGSRLAPHRQPGLGLPRLAAPRLPSVP